MAGRAHLETEKGAGVTVVLRDVVEADLPIFFEDQLDPVANQMAAFAPRKTFDEFAAHWRTILADGRLGKKTILFEGKVAGNIVSFETSGERLIGYWIGRKYWGRGIATRALSAFLGLITERPLHARVAKQNIASIRVLEKCGFTVCREETGSDGVDEYVFELKERFPLQRPTV